MPVTVDWFLVDKVLKVDIIGAYSLEELQKATAEAFRRVEAADSEFVHLLVDTSKQDVSHKPSAMKVGQAVAPIMRHHRLGWALVYGDTGWFARFLGEIVAGISRTRYRMFETEADALVYLKAVDPSVTEAIN